MDTIYVIAVAIVKTVVYFGILMLHVAYATYAERKIIGHIQLRLGPMVVGPHGLLQPIADVVKLIFKEDIIPIKVDRIVFRTAPLISLTAALSTFAVIPVDKNWVIADINVGLLYVIGIAGIGTYGIIFSGWASNSKYAFLGGLRSAAQMISYEVALGLSLVGVILMAESFNLTEIVNRQAELWYGMFLFPQIIGYFVFVVAMLAETNRLPFDLPEAETELVAGYFVEYSGIRFSLFYLAEYLAMFCMSALATICFWGGWTVPPILIKALPLLGVIPGIVWFLLKVYFHIFLFFWLRGTLPRYRYDQLMAIGWKILIPLALLNIVVTSIFRYYS
ncbi:MULTISPECIES: NADH-quinone oxidoreductase subunit NuoH [Thermodesulfovibrio]|jgi:NADH-quinone oxidoreductase subunit H|uniref:NADH-quinone oxidoreductase subunit H n=1 Tax=Thermodesulfovibrio yellowstonii (strain ATCC 51303 / DSM 11347 / YP87) TaxID=289376 RepID=B5YKI6_THEYD|nr:MULTISPECIES: NADH-quinone oxidoreductase subunit NuoH [Thermodesulfovibrio]ACI21783.1 NADH-quinone oxidoreductase chain h [Thermodesulfovibrio yellowstonii DSM 11347]MDI6865635.1 NADH-quinone oxidoreductase subunit NuoH [Thermodesulfovibrio yellowstonii]